MMGAGADDGSARPPALRPSAAGSGRDLLLAEVMGHSIVVSPVLVRTRIDVNHGRAQPGDLVEQLVVRLLGDARGPPPAGAGRPLGSGPRQGRLSTCSTSSGVTTSMSRW